MQALAKWKFGLGVAVCACAAALTGCGDASDQGPSAAAPGVPAALVNAAPQTVDWRVVDSANDKAAIVVRPDVGDDWPCVGYTARADESARRVEITVARDASGCAGDRSSASEAPTVTVRLKRELAGRDIMGGVAPKRPAG